MTDLALVDNDHEWLIVIRTEDSPVYAVLAKCMNKYDAQLVLDALRTAHGRGEV